MSNAPKAPGKMYPKVKAVDMDKGDTKVLKASKVHNTGEGCSGPSGGHMGAKKALESGGRVCSGGEYNASGQYGKQGKTKTQSFKEMK